MNETIKRCVAPWYSLGFFGYPKGITAMPCCFLSGDVGTVPDNNDIPMEKIWNSDAMKIIREINSADISKRNEFSNKHKYCHYCIYYQQENKLDYANIFQIDEDLTTEQQANYDLAKAEFLSGETVLKATPISFEFLLGVNCQLNCGMCFQRKLIKEDPKNAKDKITAEQILNLKPYLKKALNIILIGGEPFAMPECIKTLEGLINDPDYQNVRISLWSNAIMIDKYFDLLKKHPKISLDTSPDSLDYTYEYIRHGATWEKFEANVKEFQKISKENNLKWKVRTSNLLMKSTIDRIDEYAKWCIQNDVTAHFYLLFAHEKGNEFIENEDVYLNPQLLDSVLNWDKKINNAIELFKKAGNQNAAVDTLECHYSLIKRAYDNYVINKQNVSLSHEGYKNKFSITKNIGKKYRLNINLKKY